MADFDSIYAKLITPILNSVFNDKYIGGIFEVNNDSFFSDAVKKLTGLEISLQSKRLNNNLPKLINTGIFGKKMNFSVHAGSTEYYSDAGKALSNIKAKGEFLERLSSIAPIDLLSQCDFSFKNVLSKTPRELSAKKLFGYGYKKVPLASVYYGLARGSKKRNGLKIAYQPTTNGGAGHFDYRTAVLSGILELIQRDAFLVHWLNTVSPQKIDIDTYLERKKSNVTAFIELYSLVKDFKKYNLEYYFLNITSDIPVPAVCCVLVSNSPTGRRISLGASAGFNTDSILLSSATEATGVMGSIYFKEPFDLGDTYEPFSNRKLGRDERMLVYLNDKNYEKFKFFIANETLITISDWMSVQGTIPDYELLNNNVKKSLSYLKGLFNARKKYNKDYEVLAYEIKNKLLKLFNYKVVRMMCPALYQLYLVEHYADQNHPRLTEFSKNKNLEKIVKLNTWPHPFP